MKFLGLIALLGFAAAAPQNFQKDSVALKKQVLKAGKPFGITQKKINKAQQIAGAELKKGTEKAEAFAKKHGVTLSFSKVFDQLEAQYGNQAKKLLSKAERQGKAAYNKGRKQANKQINSAESQDLQQQINSFTFESALNSAQDLLMAQLKIVKNPAVKKNLAGIIRASSKEAGAALKKNGLKGNIIETANAKSAEYQKQNKRKINKFKNQAQNKVRAAMRQI